MRTDRSLPPSRPLSPLSRLAGDPADDEDDPDSAEDLPSWIPDGRVSRRERWLSAIRADPGRSGGIALAVVAAIAVLVTVFMVIRDTPEPVVSAKLPPVEMVSSEVPRPSGNQIPQPDVPAVVSVVGLVHQPGLVTLAPGSRIADAVSAAGGALDGADLIGLNLAGRLADGQQIVVGLAAPAGQPAALGSSVTSGSSVASTPSGPSEATAGSSPSAPVDLNTATVEQLDALPGVGPVTAAAIVAWRAAHGKFSKVDELGDVDGIGPARLERLRNLVTV